VIGKETIVMPPDDLNAIAALAGRLRFPAAVHAGPAGREPRASAPKGSFEAALEAIRSASAGGPDRATTGRRGAVAGGLLAGGTLAALGRAATPPDGARARPEPWPAAGDPTVGEAGVLIWPGPNPCAAGPRRSAGQPAGSRSGPDPTRSPTGTDAVEPQVAVVGVDEEEATPRA
jgi:hypothetical protein